MFHFIAKLVAFGPTLNQIMKCCTFSNLTQRSLLVFKQGWVPRPVFVYSSFRTENLDFSCNNWIRCDSPSAVSLTRPQRTHLSKLSQLLYIKIKSHKCPQSDTFLIENLWNLSTYILAGCSCLVEVPFTSPVFISDLTLLTPCKCHKYLTIISLLISNLINI